MEWVGFSLQQWNFSLYPNSVIVGFSSKMEAGYGIMVLHISNINRSSDSQTVVGMTKLAVILQESISYLVGGHISCLWEGFGSACCASQTQKVGDHYVVSYWTSWKSTSYWKMWENHKNIQNRFKMAWPLLFFVIYFKHVLFFFYITWMQITSVCGGVFSLKPHVLLKPYIKSIWTSGLLRTTVKSWKLSHSQTAYEKL